MGAFYNGLSWVRRKTTIVFSLKVRQHDIQVQRNLGTVKAVQVEAVRHVMLELKLRDCHIPDIFFYLLDLDSRFSLHFNLQFNSVIQASYVERLSHYHLYLFFGKVLIQNHCSFCNLLVAFFSVEYLSF